MKKKSILMMIILLVLSLSIVACGNSESDNVEKADMKQLDKEKIKDEKEDEKQVKKKESREDFKERIDKLEKDNEELMTLKNTSQPNNLLARSLQVMNYIKIKDFQGLSTYVHPSKGVRFSPYFFVDEENHQSFTAQEIAGISQHTDVLTWGTQDGTGNPIELNFSDYYDRYIYDNEYVNPHLIGVNNPIGQGNITDNVTSVYADGKYVEYHFKGFNQEHDGMDWRSLRLVFEKNEDTWYLVGVVHGEWTI